MFSQTRYVLAESFQPLFAYGVMLQKQMANSQPSYQSVREYIMRNFHEAAMNVRSTGIDPRDYDYARFAICCWLDELLLNLPWVHRDEWQRSLLQTELYQSMRGGDEFFERLNQLAPDQNTIREVYYQCMALGFKGRFCHDGDEMILQQLKRSSLRLLNPQIEDTKSYENKLIFRDAYDRETIAANNRGEHQQKPPLSLSRLVVFFGPPLFIGVLYLIYTMVLNGVSENLMTRVVGG